MTNTSLTNKPFKCHICQCTQADFLTVQELMHDTKDSFDYAQCQQCGCLQLLDVPQDLPKYYPSNYYSYATPKSKRTIKEFRRGLKRHWVLTHPKLLSPIFRLLFKKYALFWAYRRLGMNSDWKVLDVGAGSGAHVMELRSARIQGALGVDPFLKEDIYLNGKLVVQKSTLDHIHEQYELITFHHSFEHIPNQLDTLVRARNLLKPGGCIMIRIPTVSSDAFEIYREHWFQLDAPRHLFLHSHESIKTLAHQANLSVHDLWCDASEMQFVNSEYYQGGISLSVVHENARNKKPSLLGKNKIVEFKRQTKALNLQLRGDQICVILKSSV